MNREQKEILKLQCDDLPRTADEVADELFKDVTRIVALTESLVQRRYLTANRSGEGRLTLRITGRGKRFMAKFPDFYIQ